MKRTVPPRCKASAERIICEETSSAFFRLQEKLLEILASGRDAVVATGEASRRFTVYLRALLRAGRSPSQTKALIIVPSAEAAGEIEEYARFLSRKNPEDSPVVTVGIEPNPRNESRRLSGAKGILIGTPERIIDHLRRGNTDLADIGLVLLDCPPEPEMPDFSADVQFIYSRTGFRPQTLVLTGAPSVELERLKTVLTRPRNLEMSFVPAEPRYRYFSADNGGRGDLLFRVLQSEFAPAEPWLIIANPGTEREIRSKMGGFLPVVNSENPERLRFGGLPALEHPSSGLIRHIAFDGVPSPEDLTAIQNFYRHCEFPGDVVIIIEERERAALLNAQENIKVNMEKNENPRDDAVVQGLIRSIVQKVKEEENPQELNYYKKLFTGNVSIFLRSYVAAYLIKQLSEESGGRRRRSPAKTPGRPNMTTLFFGLGKNRKVFPRDISGLITEGVPDFDRADIGEIKILDNYSFVEISEASAGRVIEALNGADYRGRKLVVNFARKKEGASE